MEKQSDIDIGMQEKDRKHAAEGAARILASTYALYLKTQYYHWNVVGAEFYNLHLMFEQQYKELREAVDEIAERMRALGAISPGTFHEFIELKVIEEDAEVPRDWRAMVGNLDKGHERLAKECRDIIHEIPETGDEGTIDLLIQRLKVHEKTAWMLRSLLKQATPEAKTV
jgi:starvation-inducible DNA-binding protein